MPFQTSDVLALIRRDGIYVLTAPVVYQGNTDIIIVPSGFTTDLASVPRMFRALLDVAGIHDRAAILHDYNCTRQADAHAAKTPTPISSVDTDGLFRRCLRELGVPRLTRTMYWLGVRWGALKNPVRRAGWWRTAPQVILLSLPLLIVLLPYAVGVALISVLLAGVGGVINLDDPSCPSTAPVKYRARRRGELPGQARRPAADPYRSGPGAEKLREAAAQVAAGKLTPAVIMTASITGGSGQIIPSTPRPFPTGAARAVPAATPEEACTTCKHLLCAAYPDCPPDAPHMPAGTS